MDSIQLLVREHDNILCMLDIIHEASLRIMSGGAVPVDDFKKMVDFIRKYADKTHHGKEEEMLFQAMVDELGEVGVNLVRHGMLVEHDIGRLYVSDLDMALDAYKTNPTAEAKLSILVAAGSYEQLLRRHIQKENDVIFPFGEKNLSQPLLQNVEERTQRFEADESNTAERERQLDVLSALEKKYHKNNAENQN